jgi:glycerol-3-phosphate dehydrogenase
MNRDHSLKRLLTRREAWDIAIIGGGASGMGIALDAACRELAVCLLEQHDFGKGTSSRSTKLIHGGVRYLRQGNVSLVKDSLRERGLLLKNAPHLVHDLTFIIPRYKWWEAAFYGAGMKVYDLLAGGAGFGKSRLLSKVETLRHLPTLNQAGLRGGVLYHDGQFDDARLLIDLAQTATSRGAVLLNYAKVVELSRDAGGQVDGVGWVDQESKQHHDVKARCVINASGAFSDAVRRLDDPAARPMIAPSQGAHVVLDRSFLPGNSAIMVPRTEDGRVMFAIPWQSHTLLGTTDTPIDAAAPEPVPMEQEIDFLLNTAARYLARPPKRADILSTFAGVRPLVKAIDSTNTSKLSRDHTIHVSASGLITIAGGKWTTYRKMAEDCLDHAASIGKIGWRQCTTRAVPILNESAPGIRRLVEQSPDLSLPIHAALPIAPAQVIWAVRHEMARTVEDVLSRRTRALPLNARAAIEMAPAVARLMAAELQRDESWQLLRIAEFVELAKRYLPRP